MAVGSADRKFPENLREFADFGRFNLWRPIVVDRTGGSKWVSALPTGGSKWVQAQPAGSKWVSALPTSFVNRTVIWSKRAEMTIVKMHRFFV